MAGQVPESLRRLIAALDIIFLFIYLAASYLPFIYSSWNYRKGIVLRRDLWIASAILVVSAIRMTGMLFFIIYYITNESSSLDRVTLSLRVMLALIISPIDAKVTRWAFKTCKSYRFHAIMIWLLAPIFLMINRWFSSAGRPSPANPSLLRPDGWYSWMIGTMLGVVIFLISYDFNCKLKQEAINDMTDFWIQFTGAITGWGG
ncbi:hypothetical protein NCS56_01155400 [Fusarium sp. Ph1]|nr:hypothetical protein NCS56_01155400 [Fusarium sp. Ph1]